MIVGRRRPYMFVTQMFAIIYCFMHSKSCTYLLNDSNNLFDIKDNKLQFLLLLPPVISIVNNAILSLKLK